MRVLRQDRTGSDRPVRKGHVGRMDKATLETGKDLPQRLVVELDEWHGLEAAGDTVLVKPRPFSLRRSALHRLSVTVPVVQPDPRVAHRMGRILILPPKYAAAPYVAQTCSLPYRGFVIRSVL